MSICTIKCLCCGEYIVNPYNSQKYCNKICKAKMDREERIKNGCNFRYYYDMDRNDYNNILNYQNNRCAVCGETNKKLYVDHCHITFLIRGLICAKCNMGIAKLGDSISGVLKALLYLHSMPAQKVIYGRKVKKGNVRNG